MDKGRTNKGGINKAQSVVFLIAVMLLSMSIMSSIGIWNNRSFYFDEYIYNNHLFGAQTRYCADLNRFLSDEMTEAEEESFQLQSIGIYYYVVDDNTKEVFSNLPEQIDYTKFSAQPDIKTMQYYTENSSTGNMFGSLIENPQKNSGGYFLSGYIFIDISAGPLLSSFFLYQIDAGFGLQRILYIETAIFTISFVLGGIILIASLRNFKSISAVVEYMPLDVTIASPAIAAMVWVFTINTYLNTIKAFSFLSRRIILYPVLTALIFVILFFLIVMIIKVRGYMADKSKFKWDIENRLTKNTPTWLICMIVQMIWYFVILFTFSPRPYIYDYTIMLKDNVLSIIIHNIIITAVFLFIRRLHRIKTFYAEEVLCSIQEIAKGNFEKKVPVTGDDSYAKIASAVNTIREAYIHALEEQKKSERLKYELVTNISHDLRTPLTSILNYIGLVKKRGTPENIEKYIDHVDANAMKLNLLIEDLFELSKIESGNVELNIADVDIVLLLKQIAHEYEERLKQNSLEILMDFANERYFLKCDGLKTWRVFDNIINNAVKYSLAGTRIYVSTARESGEAGRLLTKVKNIASYKMNYEPEELFLRFKRGDDSRSTEGSGLGLAIAKGLVELHNGEIHIETEGDMFKVNIYL